MLLIQIPAEVIYEALYTQQVCSAISALKAFETSHRATLIKIMGLVSLKIYRYL